MCHNLTEGRHIIQENVTIYIGKYHIEHSAYMREHMGISLKHLYPIRHTVYFGIMARVIRTPFVNVIRHGISSTAFQGSNG